MNWFIFEASTNDEYIIFPVKYEKSLSDLIKEIDEKLYNFRKLLIDLNYDNIGYNNIMLTYDEMVEQNVMSKNHPVFRTDYTRYINMLDQIPDLNGRSLYDYSKAKLDINGFNLVDMFWGNVEEIDNHFNKKKKFDGKTLYRVLPLEEWLNGFYE